MLARRNDAIFISTALNFHIAHAAAPPPPALPAYLLNPAVLAGVKEVPEDAWFCTPCTEQMQGRQKFPAEGCARRL